MVSRFFLKLMGLYWLSTTAFAGTIIVLGDSLSAAYGINQADGWVTLLSKRLASEQPNWQVVNAAISGDTTSGALARFPAILAENQPDIVIIELGGNDGLRGLTIPAMTNNLNDLINLAKDKQSAVLLCGVRLPPNYGPKYNALFKTAFQTLATKHNALLIPELLNGIDTDPALMQQDGIHPNATAQSTILDNVWPSIIQLINAQQMMDDSDSAP